MLIVIASIVLIFTLIIITQFYSKKTKDFKSFLIKCILYTIFLELTVFNINYYRVNFSHLQEMNYNKDSLKLSLTEDGNKQVKIDNINQKVKSIYIELENEYKVDYEIYYSDDTTIGMLLGTKTYVRDVDKTKYTVIDLSRKC